MSGIYEACSSHGDCVSWKNIGENIRGDMKIVHVELDEANDIVLRLHRHHKKVLSHRFSIGVEMGGQLIGCVIIGRPVARRTDQRMTLEVTRLVTDGTANACSLLYSAAARAGKELGYKRIQTFILKSEPGTSLKAAGWKYDGETTGRSWSVPSREREDKHPIGIKTRWMRELNA